MNKTENQRTSYTYKKLSQREKRVETDLLQKKEKKTKYS